MRTPVLVKSLHTGLLALKRLERLFSINKVCKSEMKIESACSVLFDIDTRWCNSRAYILSCFLKLKTFL